MEKALVGKVFLISTLIAVVIKYGVSQLNISANTVGAIVGVGLPPLVLGLVLLWRARSQMPNE